MRSYLVFLVLGVGTGAVYAALALGLIAVHRASGVVNFAHGAMASAAAYGYAELADAGWPFGAALVAALAGSAALGLAVYVVVFHRLRAAPALSRVVAGVAVMVVIQAALVLWFGTGARVVAPILPAEPVTIGGAVVPRDRLWLAAAVVVATLLLALLYRRTRFGLASRAAATDPEAVARAGWSPPRLAAANWALASVVAGAAGILAAPIASLSPVTYSLLVVPALAAALAAGLRSFGVATAVALGLGMAQSALLRLQIDLGWLPRVGLRDGLPFLLLVAVVLVRGRPLRTAGRARLDGGGPGGAAAGGREHRLPGVGRSSRPGVMAAGVVVAAAGAVLCSGPELRLGLIQSLVAATLCLSVVVVTGYCGQVSLAPMTFAGLAGYVLGWLGEGAGVPFPVAPLLAALVGAAGGLAVGLAALRVRGTELAVLTLALAVAAEELIFRNPSLTGGLGGVEIPDPRIGGLDLAVGGASAASYPRPGFGLLALAGCAVVALAVAHLRHRALGRRMLVVRGGERAAAAAGVGVGAAKLWAFGLSGLVAGLGGVVLAYSRQEASFASYGAFMSLTVVVLATLGGAARTSGALLGGALAAGGVAFTLLDRVAGLGRFQLVAAGLGALAVVLLAPDGAAASIERAGRRAMAAIGVAVGRR